MFYKIRKKKKPKTTLPICVCAKNENYSTPGYYKFIMIVGVINFHRIAYELLIIIKNLSKACLP